MSLGHQYERRPAGVGPDDSLRRLAEWIPRGATVLELGPASGYFSRHLKEALGCTVDAVELDPAMAEQARPYCRTLVVGDLSTLDLSANFKLGTYHAIVAADVIEHLVEPRAVIQALRGFLAPGGALLISVPNVAYAGLVASLLDGQFEYRDEGLLDRTHLRFFTRNSLAALLEGGGLYAQAWGAVFRPLNESEFKMRLETLPTSVRDVLLAPPYALCYQWIVKAGCQPAPAAPPEPPRLQVDGFPLRVHFHVGDSPDSPNHEALTWGEVGNERQTLSIALPPLSRSPIRLYLSDRPGFMRIYSISLLVGEAPVWSWQPGDDTTALADMSDGLSIAPTGDHLLAMLHLPHAWMTLNTGALTLPVGGTLLVDSGWPMSADYMVAAHGWQQAVGQLTTEIETLRRQFTAGSAKPLPPDFTTHCRSRWRRWAGRLLRALRP